MKKVVFSLFSLLLVLAVLLAACQPTAQEPTSAGNVPTQASTSGEVAPTQSIADTQTPVQPAATQAPVTNEPIPGGTLIFARASEAQGLDPHLQTAFSSFLVLDFIFESLFTYDVDMNLVGQLAEDWSWSEDGKILTVKLRPNVVFHNGDTMDAEDVKFSLDRVLDEATGASGRSYIVDVTEINVIDPLTVELVLSKPNASILSGLANANLAIISKELVEGGADPAQEVIGTGPFMLESWEPDQVLMLVKNPDYWMEGLPYLDAIEMRVIPDEPAILAGLRAGEIDFAQFNSPSSALTAETDANLILQRAPALAYHVLQLNSAREVFKDERVRQALSCAIDRQEVIDSASLGEGQVTGPVTNKHFANPASDLYCYTPDLDQARDLLEQAGGAENVKFTIMAAFDEPPTAVAEAQSIQAQLANVGITVEIETLELGVYIDRWLAGDFDATVALNGGGSDPSLELGRYWKFNATFADVSNYQTEELDRLLNLAEVETDDAKRVELFTETEQILTKASPWIWLYTGNDYRVMQPWVKNFTLTTALGNILLREAWLDK
ncbi:MAG: ABC transporter substrate-binding protein [Chloroflexi bacterium]|nr:ABC transporter substrate-binding protein [Chloroflexota bacterium]